MSALLDALIAQRKAGATSYAKYLAKLVELTKKAKTGPDKAAYPAALNSRGKRSLYDNLGKNSRWHWRWMKP